MTIEEAAARTVAIYSDGGVIGSNPSSVGGVWAFCGVDAGGKRIVEASGVRPATPDLPTVTNNFAEYIAAVQSLEWLPRGWDGFFYSDSSVTIGRLFRGHALNGIPPAWAVRGRYAVERLGSVQALLVQGHPTGADLRAGYGSRGGLPVSPHNVWCDRACREAADAYRRNMHNHKEEAGIA